MREGVGSSSSNMAFSALSWEDRYEGGVGMLMLLMKVYEGAFITLMHGIVDGNVDGLGDGFVDCLGDGIVDLV